METEIKEAPVAAGRQTYRTKLVVSIRHKPGIRGLPGDDPTQFNRKVGSSIKNNAPLSGLTKEEEKRYLPEIIGFAPDAADWGLRVAAYWNNISVRIPHDALSTDTLPGKVLEFVLEFSKAQDKNDFDNSLKFEEKAEISKKGVCIEGLPDFILFRYCILYNRVSNSLQDVYKSPKIWFYLYSKGTETKIAHKKMKNELNAINNFADIVKEEALVDGILRMFKQLPHTFEKPEDKEMALWGFAKSKPDEFVRYANDGDIKVKSLILAGVEKGIIYNPSNTDSYYYGQNQETLLGSSLNDAVLWFRSKQGDTEAQIKQVIVAKVKEE